MDLTEKFTAEELRDAATRLGVTIEPALQIAEGPGPWDSWQLQRFGTGARSSLVTLGRIIQDASTHRAEDVLRDLRKRLDASREPVPVAGENDVIYGHELKEALWALKINNTLATRAYTDSLADRIMHYAAERREPEYSPGTTVRDAAGAFFQRSSKGWLMFGVAHVVDHAYPARPLEVLHVPV